MPITGAKCGAKAKRSGGQPCKGLAMANGKCRVHGGKSGPPKGNQNARKNGIYTSVLKDHEIEWYDPQRKGRLDDAIALIEVQIHNIIAAMNAVEDPNDPEETTGLAVTEIHRESTGKGAKVSVTSRRPDYMNLLNVYTGRLAKLEKTKAEIEASQNATDPMDVAREIRGLVQGMVLTIPKDKPEDDEDE